MAGGRRVAAWRGGMVLRWLVQVPSHRASSRACLLPFCAVHAYMCIQLTMLMECWALEGVCDTVRPAPRLAPCGCALAARRWSVRSREGPRKMRRMDHFTAVQLILGISWRPPSLAGKSRSSPRAGPCSVAGRQRLPANHTARGSLGGQRRAIRPQR